MILSIVLSYNDARFVDGSLTYGFPLPMYFETAGFMSVPESGVILFAVIIDTILISGLSFAIVYFFGKIKNR